jgi:ribosomal-protein-alanine N-acetyltransferase
MAVKVCGRDAMQLTLSKSLLRSFQPGDVSSLTQHAGTYSVARNLNLMPHPYSLQDAEAWIALATSQNPETQFAIAIENEVVGGIGLRLDDPERKGGVRYSAELGYWLGEPFGGTGHYDRSGHAAFAAWAFGHFELVRIHASVYARKLASARVLARAGFEFEGRLRACYFKEDEFIDGLLYAKVQARGRSGS